MNTQPHPSNLALDSQSSPSDHRHWEADLKLIVEGIASQIGTEFFRVCVRYLAELLQIRYAFIAEFIDGDEPKAKVLAFWAGDDFGPEFEYVLTGTPCGIVLDQGLQIYEYGVQQKFPEDIDLVTMGAESYLGVPICNSQGKPIGHIAGLHVQPLTRSYEEQAAILKIFAARSAAEIERQLIEKALKQQNQRLEETLMQLKQTQVQLIHAEKMSGLGNMVAGIAHEINNPISFIHGNLDHAHQYFDDLLGLIQLYQQEYPQPRQVIQEELETLDLNFIQTDLKQLFQSMKFGSQRIEGIVKSCRNFSRLDESNSKIVDIHEGIEATLIIVESRLQSSDLSSRIEVVKEYKDLPKIHCFPAQLNQVFLNLLNNAVDALEEADRKRAFDERFLNVNTIWIRTVEIAGKQIEISISDNGLGIPDEIQAKVFDPFFTTKSVGKGTGLGLSVSYYIITDLHEGTIIVDSHVGQGTTFKIRLPIGQGY
ncbi:sensor histidine kinase [Leptothoe sp. PORK10 BA2]|uniref:sensor histidine kinase n=1 Tax=Leptothoe sp. PORK10 BA2 TaxID=3110254 RepID=UPI002B214D54|nr:ATP-binding protein [Leptothoe sp. PORK10 BA2]MEA5467138.1 ATP-binding protein [Leptothoe sp. PORK10 BA2]